MKHTDKIEIENKIPEIGKVVEWIESIGEKLDFPVKSVFDLTLSLDEILTNIISYGFDDTEKHIIHVSYDYNGDTLELTITDDGKAFNPLESDTPDLDLEIDEMEIGGLGIMLVKEKMDDVRYSRDNEHNILVLKKIIKE